jgi:hypothetical protein
MKARPSLKKSLGALPLRSATQMVSPLDSHPYVISTGTCVRSGRKIDFDLQKWYSAQCKESIYVGLPSEINSQRNRRTKEG